MKILARVLKVKVDILSPTLSLEGGSFHTRCGGLRGRGVFGRRANRHPRSETVLPRSRDGGAGGLHLAGGLVQLECWLSLFSC